MGHINRVQWSSCLSISSFVQFCWPSFKRLASRLHVEEVELRWHSRECAFTGPDVMVGSLLVSEEHWRPREGAESSHSPVEGRALASLVFDALRKSTPHPAGAYLCMIDQSL